MNSINSMRPNVNFRGAMSDQNPPIQQDDGINKRKSGLSQHEKSLLLHSTTSNLAFCTAISAGWAAFVSRKTVPFAKNFLASFKSNMLLNIPIVAGVSLINLVAYKHRQKQDAQNI